MTKGKYGITYAAIAGLAFILVFFNLYQVLILLVGYAIIAENNSWLTRHALLALYLRTAFTIASILISALFSGIGALFSAVRAFGAVTIMNSANIFFQGALNIFLFIICIYAFFKVIKEHDAVIPVLSDLVDKSMGIFKPKPEKPAPSPQNYPTPPASPPPPVVESVTSSAEWVCECGNRNSGKFCSGCGSKKS